MVPDDDHAAAAALIEQAMADVETAHVAASAAAEVPE
jgi:hypothetical protein